MAWIYEVLEVHNKQGKASGRYRLVRWDDANPEKLIGLCPHAHEDADDALHCHEASLILDNEFRERISMPKKSYQS